MNRDIGELAISVRDVSKKYRLFDSARDRLKEALHPFARRYHKEFWALNGVSFDVPRGQTIGILGKNGSGKSTLLQILAGVMQPTGGSVVVSGRVSALLALGAGFNPEYTGRENVRFQAQVMGFQKDEIERLIPEVEEFADIGSFFDQPVKIYSSGMFVRVAFGVASSVNPDVLIIDEALAVGDVRFQRKCLLRLEKNRCNGATIVIVSHSLDAITSLCSRAIVLDQAKIVADGEPKFVVEEYLNLLFSDSGVKRAEESATQSLAVEALPHQDSMEAAGAHDFFRTDSNANETWLSSRAGYNRHEVRTCNGSAAIIDYLIVTDGRADVSNILSGAAVTIFVKVRFDEPVAQPIIGFEVKTGNGVTLTGSNTFLAKTQLRAANGGETRVYRIDFDTPLNQGDYFVDLGVAKYDGSPSGLVLDVRRSAIHITVTRVTEKRFNGVVDIGFRFAEFDR